MSTNIHYPPKNTEYTFLQFSYLTTYCEVFAHYHRSICLMFLTTTYYFSKIKTEPRYAEQIMADHLDNFGVWYYAASQHGRVRWYCLSFVEGEADD